MLVSIATLMIIQTFGCRRVLRKQRIVQLLLCALAQKVIIFARANQRSNGDLNPFQ